MISLERMMVFAYVLAILGGSYLGVSTLRALWVEARQLETIASLRMDDERYKILVLDAIEPAAGKR